MSLIKYRKSKIIYFIPTWLKRLIYKVWRICWKLKVKILPDRYYIDPYANGDFIYVNPKNIIFAVKKEFNIYKFKGRVLGDNWDKEVANFDDFDFFKSFKERIEKKTSWEETEYYKRVSEQIRNGIFKWSCKNIEEFDRRCEEWDRLFAKIKKEGYKKGWHEDEVSVNIGRNGELIFNNGRHRLVFAKLLKMEKIPVKVTVRHKNWVSFKNEIFAYAKKFDNKVYAPLTHPDLEHIPSYYDNTRFEIIKEHLTIESGTMFDIGGHWGYFCHKFEEEGFECYCVEKSTLNLYFLEKLKKAENKKFKVIPCSLFDMSPDTTKEFDVILALSIFHHFIKEKNTYRKLILFLRNLKGKELFFEPHNPKEPQMRKAYRNFVNDEFACFIVQNSSFTKFEKIGTSEHGRNLYKIY